MIDHLAQELLLAEKHGDLDKQLEIGQHLLPLLQDEENRVGQIVLLRHLGNVYQDKGIIEKAHSMRLAAKELADDPSSLCPPEVYQYILADLGRSCIVVRQFEKALDLTEQAISISRSLNDKEAQCIFNINLESIFANTGKLEEAYELSAHVLEIAKEIKDDSKKQHYVLALQYLNLASFSVHELYLNRGIRYARLGLKHATKDGSPNLIAHAQQILGKAYTRARMLTGNKKYSGEAENHLMSSEALTKKTGDLFLEIDNELELASLAQFQHQVDQEALHCKRAVALAEELRNTLGYEDFQLSFFDHFQLTYDRIIQFFLRQREIDLAFKTSEQLRSRLLLAQLGERHTRFKPKKITASQYNELNDILTAYSGAVLGQVFGDGFRGKGGGVTVGFEDDNPPSAVIEDARQRFAHFDSQRLSYLRPSSSTSDLLVGLQESQNFLGKKDALISYLVTEESIIVFAMTEKSYHFQHLAYSKDNLENDIHELCESITAIQDEALNPLMHEEWFSRNPRDPWPPSIRQRVEQFNAISEKIFAILIAPILPVISEKPHWVIVPHGPLHLVPWSGLRGRNDYIIQSHTISLLPSVSIGMALTPRITPVGTKAIFFADPDPEDPNLNLPASQSEVIDSYQVFGNGPKPFIGLDATKQQLFRHSDDAGLLHFACHHVFDAKAPLLSFLKLNGKKGLDFLYVFEIAELDLCAELVSLSSCQSGRSRILTGDEQYGMVRAFLVAGAKSVVSTLWSIEDQSAALFFTSFYKIARYKNLGEALAEAQRRLLGDYRYELPCFWAPYLLSGTWKKPLSF